jgi:hypothetical protein
MAAVSAVSSVPAVLTADVILGPELVNESYPVALQLVLAVAHVLAAVLVKVKTAELPEGTK